MIEVLWSSVEQEEIFFCEFDLDDQGDTLTEIFCELGIFEHPLTTSFVRVKNFQILDGATGATIDRSEFRRRCASA
jgi:hypothetical protein